MHNPTPAEVYREVRNEAGKDVARALFALFIGMPVTLFAFLTLSDYMGGFYAAAVIFIFFVAVAALRKHGMK
jgi:hypothetical protein